MHEKCEMTAKTEARVAEGGSGGEGMFPSPLSVEFGFAFVVN